MREIAGARHPNPRAVHPARPRLLPRQTGAGLPVTRRASEAVPQTASLGLTPFRPGTPRYLREPLARPRCRLQGAAAQRGRELLDRQDQGPAIAPVEVIE